MAEVLKNWRQGNVFLPLSDLQRFGERRETVSPTVTPKDLLSREALVGVGIDRQPIQQPSLRKIQSSSKVRGKF